MGFIVTFGLYGQQGQAAAQQVIISMALFRQADNSMKSANIKTLFELVKRGRLSPDEAIALAFATEAPRQPGPAGLTEREAQVARLVADGLSNKAIAVNLQLSVRTVESHVRHLLAKTRLDNRTQLATWARERIQ